MDCELRTRRSDNLLFLSPRKLAQNCLGNRCGGLDGQRVHKQRRSGRHVEQYWADRGLYARRGQTERSDTGLQGRQLHRHK